MEDEVEEDILKHLEYEDEFQEDISEGEEDILTLEQMVEHMRQESLSLFDTELIEELGLDEERW